jgi:hypothetical protein
MEVGVGEPGQTWYFQIAHPFKSTSRTSAGRSHRGVRSEVSCTCSISRRAVRDVMIELLCWRDMDVCRGVDLGFAAEIRNQS